MRVDVVILSWNRLAPTLDAIASARAQRGVQVRIYVVDQGSEPTCVDRLRREAADHEDTELLELGENLGVAGGRNRGMALGRGELVASLDNDAEFADPGVLDRTAARFADDPALGALGFRILVHATGDDDRLSWAYPRALLSRRGERLTTTRFCGCGHAIRRSALERTGGYDERLFFYWEELDLAYQLIEAGYRIEYDPSIAVLHKVDPEARIDWSGHRYYYLVRNALYLEWKYHRSPPRLAARALGYQLKGVVNRKGRQTATALRDAAGMIRRLEPGPGLSRAARAYIVENDERHRGTMVDRLRVEVLERLPAQR